MDENGNKAGSQEMSTIMPGSEKNAETNKDVELDLDQQIDIENRGREIAVQEDPDNALSEVIKHLDSLKEGFHRLEQGFESKIKYDTSKDRIIENLHRELQSYREGLQFQIMRPLFIDLISIHDDLANLLKHHKNDDNDDRALPKLIQNLESFQDTIETILERYGVMAFNESHDQLIPQRQRVNRTEMTDDPAKDRMVYEHLRKGFEYDGKIIRPEVVSIFKYSGESVPQNFSKEEQA